MDVDLVDLVDPAAYQINTDLLIEEWARQPALMADACRKLAEARKKLRLYRRRVKVGAARLALAILSDPGKYNLPKTTDKVVEAAVIVDADQRELQAQLEEAEYACDIYEGVQTALVDKRKALEAAVALFGMEYFSSPREPKSKVRMDHFRIPCAGKPIKRKEGSCDE